MKTNIAIAQEKTNEPMTQEMIAKKAHEIWERGGQVVGHEMDHWLEAEQELRGESEEWESLTLPGSDELMEAREFREKRRRGASPEKIFDDREDV